jgi:GWxTD domain-containing protein
MRRLSALLTMVLFSKLFVPSFACAQGQSASQNDLEDAQESNFVRWLSPLYRVWLTEDVGYVITREERSAFLQLTSDADRDWFIEQFWQRRNPVPLSEENTFKEEHYRRMAYANEHFSREGIPGWKADRGRIYIEWGQPDAIDLDSVGVAGSRQLWRYRYLEGVGENVELEFTDPRHSGEYHLTAEPTMPDGRFLDDGVGSEFTDCVQALSDRNSAQSSQLVPRFRDLEALAVSHISRNDVNFEYHFVAPVPVTFFTSQVRMTIEVAASEFRQQESEADQPIRLNLFCQITDGDGRVVETLEDQTLDPVGDSANKDSAESYFPKRSIALRPGSYQVAMVVSNPRSGNVGTAYTELVVPPESTQTY